MDNRILDNLPLSGFGSLLSIDHGDKFALALAAPAWVGQILTWFLMTVGGTVVIHCVKFLLNRYLPYRNSATKARSDDDIL